MAVVYVVPIIESKANAYPKSKFASKDFTEAMNNISAIRYPNAKKDSIDVTKSPSVFLTNTLKEDQLLFCQC
jgi:hypothetical protein